MIKCFSRKIENPCKLCIYKGLSSLFVPLTVLFSNQFLHDLDLIWELREFIPL